MYYVLQILRVESDIHCCMCDHLEFQVSLLYTTDVYGHHVYASCKQRNDEFKNTSEDICPTHYFAELATQQAGPVGGGDVCVLHCSCAIFGKVGCFFRKAIVSTGWVSGLRGRAPFSCNQQS